MAYELRNFSKVKTAKTNPGYTHPRPLIAYTPIHLKNTTAAITLSSEHIPISTPLILKHTQKRMIPFQEPLGNIRAGANLPNIESSNLCAPIAIIEFFETELASQTEIPIRRHNFLAPGEIELEPSIGAEAIIKVVEMTSVILNAHPIMVFVFSLELHAREPTL